MIERGLLTEEQLAEKLQMSVSQLRKLRYSKKIPFFRIGYKSIRFDFQRVLSALDRLEVKEVQ